MTNPTVAPDVSDSGGWFPQIFAAEDTFYDITLKTSAGVTVKSYVNVPSIGGSDTSIIRDYGNSRLKITGSGGVIYVEAGDPSGDDTGGKIRLSGWNTTQADTAAIDAVATTVTGTLASGAITSTGAISSGGIITENSKSLPGIVYDTATFTTASSVVIPLTNSPAGTRMWDIDIIDLVMSAGATVNATFSFDNGATYASANYTWILMSQTASADAFAGGASTTLMQLLIGDNRTWTVKMRVVTTGSSGRTMLTAELAEDQAIIKYFVTGAYTSSTTRATHIKLTPASGTITGKYRSMPQRGF